MSLADKMTAFKKCREAAMAANAGIESSAVALQ